MFTKYSKYGFVGRGDLLCNICSNFECDKKYNKPVQFEKKCDNVEKVSC